jgi:transposase-like protein
MRSRVHQDGPAVLQLLRSGATATEAAAATGVPVNTVRSWVSRYPEFRSAGKPALTVIEGRAGVPDRAELLELLTVQARNGSVRAIELLMREVPAQATADVQARARKIVTAALTRPSS